MKQDWIIDVLSDLGKFAKDNGMDALASRIKDAQLMTMVEIESKQEETLIVPVRPNNALREVAFSIGGRSEQN
ncbi:MAG: hypothetical protein VW297_10310 [Paracoccaceae bacterium]